MASAVVVMGGWAGFANRAHGGGAVFRAALTQSGASAFVTYTLKTSLEAISSRLRGRLAFVVPPAVSCTAVLALLVTAHAIAGTRELWSTIALPYGASSAYALVYSAILARRPRA